MPRHRAVAHQVELWVQQVLVPQPVLPELCANRPLVPGSHPPEQGVQHFDQAGCLQHNRSESFKLRG